MNRLNEFKKFHHLLMAGAPAGYVPWYFPVVKDGKIPDGRWIAKRGKGNGSWKADHARLSFREARDRIEAGLNVGLAARANDSLQIVDCDTNELFKELKPTLLTRGRSRIGGHGWYFAKE